MGANHALCPWSAKGNLLDSRRRLLVFVELGLLDAATLEGTTRGHAIAPSHAAVGRNDLRRDPAFFADRGRLAAVETRAVFEVASAGDLGHCGEDHAARGRGVNGGLAQQNPTIRNRRVFSICGPIFTPPSQPPRGRFT